MKNEKEFYVVAVITDNGIETGIELNVFATNEEEAMDKAYDNIIEQNPQWYGCAEIDIMSVDEI